MASHERSKVKKDDFGVTVAHIENCARCGGGHEQLWFSRFTRPHIDAGTGMVCNYWAMCPITREPIIMGIASEQEQGAGDGR